MSELAVFSDEEVDLLAAALYKVGVWVSYAEDEDGEEDDLKEMKALAVCMRAVAKKYDGPGLVDDIAREVFARQANWERWADESFHALDGVKKALAALRARGNDADLKNYKAALVEVATTVAMAHGEFGEFDEDEGGAFGALLGKVTGAFAKLSADDKDHPMNISAVEGDALFALKEAMKDA